MRIYLDVDDTLANFRDHAVARGVPRWTGSWYTTPRETWTDEQKAIQAKTNEVMQEQDFWLSMPLNDGAFELTTAAFARSKAFLLTALPSSVPPEFYDMIQRAKVQWAWQKLHVPTERVIVCHRPEKVQYATTLRTRPYMRVQNVLIDDAIQNCDEWNGARGLAHHYQDHDEAVNFIKCL